MRGVNEADEAVVELKDRPCPLPTLLVVSERDYVTRADMQIGKSKEWVPDLRVETLDCGHWIQLERPRELLALIQQFAADVMGLQEGNEFAKISPVAEDVGNFPVTQHGALRTAV